MAIRFAAASGLALAAALCVATAARAQSFFSYYEISPRQIVSVLADEGYQLRGPMIRRGDVYVCDVTSISGRAARLIVDARDGHVLERFTAAPRWRNGSEDDAPRPPREVIGGEDRGPAQEDRSPPRNNQVAGGDPRNNQVAVGDPLSPPSRVYGNDNFFGPKPAPVVPSAPEASPTPKPKHTVAKKHHEPAVAKAPSAAPETAPSQDSAKPAGSSPSSVAAVAPSSAAEPKKPAVEAVKPPAAETPKPAAASTPKPAGSPEPAPVKAEAEKPVTAADKGAADAKPKAEGARKKINDLPVGTLD